MHMNDVILIIALYVDDLIITSSNGDLILGLKKQMKNTFEIYDFGLLHFFISIHIMQMDDGNIYFST